MMRCHASLDLNRPPQQASQPVVYEEWLAAEIEAGCAELDAGESLSSEQVWQELGLE